MADDWSIWEDLDPETDSFTEDNILVPYKGGVSCEFLREVARNTSWLYRNQSRNRFAFNESFDYQEEIDFDTDKIYVNKYIFITFRWNTKIAGLFSTPYKIEIQSGVPLIIQLTTSYQNLELGDEGGYTINFQIKALVAGGFRIKEVGMAGPSEEPNYLWISIDELYIITSI